MKQFFSPESLPGFVVPSISGLFVKTKQSFSPIPANSSSFQQGGKKYGFVFFFHLLYYII
jgi:hypothetical protein